MDTRERESRKYHACPLCQHGQGVLLVDVETETQPQMDEDGHLQYRCMQCQRTFAVEQGRDTSAPEKHS